MPQPGIHLGVAVSVRTGGRQVDTDSIDFLRFIIELDETLHVAVPEADYDELATLHSCVRYVSARLQEASGAQS